MRDLLRTRFGITDSDIIEELILAGRLDVFPKGSIIVESGKEQRYIPILLEGITRGYLIDAEGKDITDCFAYQVGDIISGCNQIGKVSQINIEAITSVKFFMLPAQMVLELLERYPKLLAVYNQYLVAALDRHWEIKMLMYRCEAMERYQWFQDNYADIIDLVSHRHIASFLGMTPVTLSRLRRKIREQSNREDGNSFPTDTWAIERIALPTCPAEIPRASFDNCQNLKNLYFADVGAMIAGGVLTLPDHVTAVGANAFCGYAAITEVHLPAATTDLNQDSWSSTTAFYLCDGLQLDDYSLTYDPYLAGPQTVTVSCEGLTAEFTITLLEAGTTQIDLGELAVGEG